ncbi:dynamin family protein [Salibacterium aidingense]|uniref:dynamin family protein n=1 Tax=Salibacterium aidingense TaxID=384933 RepID=UPI0004264B33|nr:dynamin family protein [Salibacterium aidingense]
MKAPSLTDVLLKEEERRAFFQQHQFSMEYLESFLSQLVHAKQLESFQDVQRQLDTFNQQEDAAVSVVFCGHFSAGKSTLLNHLIGNDILPSHPVPTSANVVQFQKGDRTFVRYRTSSSEVWEEATEDYLHHSWFTTDEIEELFIQSPETQLPENVKVMDTPGIDSSIAAHRLAAEAPLQEADFVCYVTDYQHVESEENFAFLKKLNGMYIEPLLLVNQVDKHEERELYFSDFQKKVTQSLKKQNITLHSLHYLSALKPETTPESWKLLNRMIQALSRDPFRYVSQSMALRVYQILEKTAGEWERKARPDAEHVAVIQPFASQQELAEKVEETRHLIEKASSWSKHLEIDMLRAVDTVFANAKITPYHTRTLAKDYLETKQSSFLPLRLFSRRKRWTELQEKQEKLIESLQENVRNYIDIHLQDDLKSIMTTYGIFQQDMKRKLFALRHSPDAALLRQAERPGSRYSDAYVSVFCRSIIDEIRKKYKASVIEWFPYVKERIYMAQQKETARLQNQHAKLEEALLVWKKWQEEYTAITRTAAQVIKHLEYSALPLQSQMEQTKMDAGVGPKSPVVSVRREPVVDIDDFYPPLPAQTKVSYARAAENMARRMEYVYSLLPAVKTLAHQKQSLKNKADRLRHKYYRVSLFGSFSAGKSTLANAIAGEPILEASANPTTSFVQSIQYPDSRHPDRTVEVQYKSRRELTEDMNDILSPAGMTLETPEDWLDMKAMEKNSGDEQEEEVPLPVEVLQPEEIVLLDQYWDSYHHLSARLNRIVQIDLQEYKEMLQRKEEVLLIRSAAIYFCCRFTADGYVLTDTPGIGSIYKRHSQTAFEELKHADAVLFITYYNHAYSKADQEFLKQLGRTKEYFSYDKMFFLVNAADLATTNKELQDVLDYVTNQFQRFGISSPRVFPISGKEELYGSGHASGVEAFLKHFQHIAENVLEQTLIKEGHEELYQAKKALAWHKQYILQKEMMEKKEEKKIRHKTQEFIEWLETYDVELDIQETERELEELMFYVKQRVFYRYFDEYKEKLGAHRFYQDTSFPPQLYRYVNELIQFIFYLLAEEIRATVIRMEYYIKRQWESMQKQVVEALPSEIKDSFAKTEWRDGFPEFRIYEHPPFQSGDLPYLKHYRTAGRFFIEGEYNELKERLEQSLRPYGDEYTASYHAYLNNIFIARMRENWGSSLTWYKQTACQVKDSLDSEKDTGELQTIDSIIQKIDLVL